MPEANVRTTVPFKRRLSASSSESDSHELVTPSAGRGKRQRKVDSEEKGESVCGPVGIGKSTRNRNQLIEDMRNGTLEISAKKRENYETKVLNIDPEAEFRYGQDGWFIFHALCGRWNKMKEPYNTDRFTSHLTHCKVLETRRRDLRKGQAQAAKDAGDLSLPAPARSLHRWFSNTTSSEQSIPSIPSPPLLDDADVNINPCAGLTNAIDPRISDYLGRTGTLGGGSRSDTVIAQQLYGPSTKFAALSEAKKEKVRLAQMHDQKWRNEHLLGKVFSVSCQKRVPPFASSTGRALTERELALRSVCTECRAVYALRGFKTAINKSSSKSKNEKFTNKRFQNEALSKVFLRCQGLQVLADNVRVFNT